MKKVIFGITSLTIGGAERVLVDIANRLCEKYDITIFTIYGEGTLRKQLDNKVKTISLYRKQYKDYNKIEKIKISLKLMFTQKAPEGYDAYIAFLEGPITRLFAKKQNSHKIAWVHNDISKVFGEGLIAKIKKHFDRKKYKKYDKIIFVSEENKNDFNKTYGNISEEVVIRNYLDYNKVIEKASQNIDLPYNKNNINLVTVCRLVEQKAIERFIKIHSKLENDGVHSKVYIVGNGPLKSELHKKIEELNETENFFLLGEKENPYPYIKEADYFCLLSYFEGYGMVLDEAKILNKQIIITNTAAKESIQGYEKSTVLENNEKDIYEGLKKILTHDKINSDFDKSKEDYLKQIDEYYEKIINKIEEIIK